MTRSYELHQVDVFTREPLAGNPLAVLPDAAGLETAQMQAIAREMNLSETTFVLPAAKAEADYGVRIFTPRSELPFAGHPTIGTAHVLLATGRLKARGERTTVRQETLAGIQPIDITRDAGGPLFTMTQPTPTFAPGPSRDVLARALRIAPDLIAGDPLTIAVGVAWHVVPLAGLDVVRGLEPDMTALAELEAETGVAVTVFARAADTPGCSVRVRSFAPGSGIPEDPVCGSGNGCVGAWLAKNGASLPLAYRAEQGIEMGRPGEVSVRVDAAGSDYVVQVGGPAVTVLEATLSI